MKSQTIGTRSARLRASVQAGNRSRGDRDQENIGANRFFSGIEESLEVCASVIRPSPIELSGGVDDEEALVTAESLDEREKRG